MKKLAMLLAACFALYGLVSAGDVRNTPEGGASNPINADYGGVDIFVSSFSINASSVGLQSPNGYGNPGSFQAFPSTFGTVASAYGFMYSTTTVNLHSRYLLYGTYFSTGNCGSADFIDVFTSTLGFSSVNVNHYLRFYNLSGSTSTTNTAGLQICQGITWFRWPLRLYGNLYMRPSSSGYNEQGILYYKEPD